MTFTRSEAKERLSCPHSNCSYYQESWSDEGASEVGKQTLTVECQTCGGRDHLMYVVGDLDASSQTQYSPGDSLTLLEDIRRLRRQTGGEDGAITAITRAPSPLIDKTYVSIRWQPNDRYVCTERVPLDVFEDWAAQGLLLFETSTHG